MTTLEGLNDQDDSNGPRVDELRRETRDSAALVLLTLAVVLTVSFVGLALTLT